MSAVRIARLSEQPLDLDLHLDAVEDSSSGAVTTFVGRVRDTDPDASDAVVALEYSAHPDAEQTLHRIAADAAAGTDAIVAVSHRVGRLEVGEAAVVIAVASGHRAAAFEVCARSSRRSRPTCPCGSGRSRPTARRSGRAWAARDGRAPGPVARLEPR